MKKYHGPSSVLLCTDTFGILHKHTHKKKRESSSAGAGNEDSHLLLAGLKPRI